MKKREPQKGKPTSKIAKGVHKIRMGNKATANVERRRKLEPGPIKFKGFYTVEVIREGKTVHKETYPNGVVNVGKDKILDVMFDAAAQIATWYLSLISLTGFTALAAGDTMGSHTGWVEFTGYSQATRPAWDPAAASGQVSTNAVPVQFDITATGTLKGGFLTSDNVKSGTTGTLWGTALFTGDIPVVSGDVVKITYSVQAS